MTLPAACIFSEASALPPRSSGKERDTESGNDYFMARYYNSATGRFLSPDWSAKEEPVPYAKLDNPQTLNLYSYVANNPLGKADPDGHGPPDGEEDIEIDPTTGRVEDETAKEVREVKEAEAYKTALTPVVTPTPEGQAFAKAFSDFEAPVNNAIEKEVDRELGPSKVDSIIKKIDDSGLKVTSNPKTPSQQGNVTITNPVEPGVKLNLRDETHPLEAGGKPVRHVNVERVEPGAKNRPVVKSNTHITDQQTP